MDSKSTETTKFASAERASEDDLKLQSREVEKSGDLGQLFETVPNITLILNHQRQIVHCNHCFLDFLDEDGFSCIRGKRPGEALGCVHSNESPGGCGTTEHCSQCGAVLAILASQNTGLGAIRECRITRMLNGTEDALDLRVWADQVTIEGEEYTLLSIMNISDEKRRQVLERLFFHDLRNTAAALLGNVTFMRYKAKVEEPSEFISRMESLTEQLLREICAQEQLMAAEKGELHVHPESVCVNDLMERVHSHYVEHDLAREREIILSGGPDRVMLMTDPALLDRVIDNMVKNALEASDKLDVITLGFEEESGIIKVSVHNPSVMEPAVKLQVFQRSFSTKGANRGVGTYSIKLLTERYLKGKVWFTSEAGEGTTFYATYPKLFES